MRWILLVLVLALSALPAHAQQPKGLPKLPPIHTVPGTIIPCDPLNKLPGCKEDNGSIFSGAAKGAETGIATALAKPFQDIADLISSDSDEAIALSTSIPELQDGNGQQCWVAMKSFGAVLKAHPVPLTLKAQSDLEALRLLTMAANNLCRNTACTQVFADLTNGINTAAPVGVPVSLPSLNSLCSKVPQIAVTAPVNVPAPPAAPDAPK
jgi:hypothetical protein